jgi:hypothetical protein
MRGGLYPPYRRATGWNAARNQYDWYLSTRFNQYKGGLKRDIQRVTNKGAESPAVNCYMPCMEPEPPGCVNGPIPFTTDYALPYAGDKQDFGRCANVGYSVAAAARQWHGNFGFLDACYTCPTDGTQGNPPTEKDLAIAWDSHFQAVLWYNFNVSPVGGYIPNSDDALPPPEGQDSSASFLYEEFTAEAVGGNSVSGENGVIQYGVVNNVLDSINSGTIDNFTFDTFTYAKNGILVDGSGNPILDGSGNTQGQGLQNCYIGFPKCGEGVIPDPIDSPNYEDVILWQVEVYGGMVIDYGIGLPSFDAEYYYNNYDGADRYVALVCMVLKFQRENETYTWNVEHYVLDVCSAYNTDAGGVVYCWGITYGTFSHGTVTLSSPNKTAGTAPAEGEYDVLYDMEGGNGLLDQWKLTDPVMMPLTTNPFGGTMVKVTRNEVGENVSPVNYVPLWLAGVPLVGGLPQVYVDPNLAILTANGLTAGQIIGLPNNLVGTTPIGDRGTPNQIPAACALNVPEDYYDPNWEFWFVHGPCDDGSSVGLPFWQLKGWGDWRSNHPELPPLATQWTNAREAQFVNACRSQFYKVKDNRTLLNEEEWNTSGSKIWSVKFAESSILFPSHNHARPFGHDRWLPDTGSDYCIDSFDGTNLSTYAATTWNVGDVIMVLGSSDGIYIIESKPDASDFTVTPLASVPTWVSENLDKYFYPNRQKNGIAFKLRLRDVPPMAGRLQVESITDNHDGTVTVVMKQGMDEANSTDYAFAGGIWNLDFCDGQMQLLRSNVAPASSSDPTTFTATVDYNTVKIAQWICLYGAHPSDPAQSGVAHWYWDDDTIKGDYYTGYWFKDNGNTIGALTNFKKPYSPFAPFMLVMSPNQSDKPDFGAFYDFVSGFVADDFCDGGSERQFACVQAMADPFWSKPMCCNNSEENPCPKDYPDVIPDLVEARFCLPGVCDGGAGSDLTESPPTVGNFSFGNYVQTDAGIFTPSQPASVYAPDGAFGGA